jgi:DNA-binding CsgD family transcriptional regulator
LERDAELAVLGEVLARAAARRPGLVAIEGPGGIGKTRLLREAQERAERAGMLVLVARGSERERQLPFGVVEQLFGPGFHEIRGVGTHANSEEAADDTDTSFSTFAALVRMTERLSADRPLVLVVDDLHLSDEPSLQFFGYLARRFGRLSATLIGTLRPFERSPTAALLSELVGDPLTVSIRPQPLTDEATAALVTQRLGSPADATFSAACREATGGNPLLLDELLKTLRFERVPPDVTRVGMIDQVGGRALLRTVLARLTNLPAGAAAIARAIAILGDCADLSLAAELAALDPAAASSAVSALIAAEILADQTTPRFVHPLVHSAVYEDIPVPERARAHARAGSLLSSRGQPAGVIAAHLLLAPPGGDARSYEVLRGAARASLRAGAPGAAVAYLQRALAEPPPAGHRADAVFALARATMLFEGPAAEPHLREALRLTSDPATRVRIAIDLARLLMFTMRVDESIPVIHEAARELGPESGDLERMLATTELMAPLFDPEYLPPRERLERGRRLPLEPGIGAKMLAAVSARHWAYGGGAADDCAALALAALDGGDLVAVDNVFLSVTAVLVLELADRPEAEAGWDALLRDADTRGSRQSELAVSLFRGFALGRRGQLGAAEASLDVALDAIAAWKGGDGRVHAAAFRSAVRRERGDLAGARAALDAVPRPEGAGDDARLWLDSSIELLLAESRVDEALVAAHDAERRFAYLANPIDTPAPQHRATALHHLGRHDEAVALAEQALVQALAWGSPGAVARARRALGLILGAAGIDHLQQAVDVARGTPARLELAKSQVELGAALRVAGRRADARPVLREALELTTLLGADGLAARARTELHTAGGRPRTTALTGPDALTGSERRVVERAVAGDTNRQIAAALFVTPKTVELHLSNAYRKLGVAGRRGLAAALQCD